MHRIRLVLVCASVLLAHPLYAQTTADSTTATFRPGQWGIEFLPGTALTEAGVLRFATPTRAWVLDGSASLDWNATSGGLLGSDAKGQFTGVSARFGPRWYRAAGAQSARFVGLGVSGGYTRSKGTGIPVRNQSWSTGAYGEIGMQYMLTRHFSLGARASLLGSRIEDRMTDISTNSTQRTTDFHIGLGLQITGAIYF